MTEIMCDRCGRDWDARDFYDNGGNDGICPKCQWSVHECGNCGERIVATRSRLGLGSTGVLGILQAASGL